MAVVSFGSPTSPEAQHLDWILDWILDLGPSRMAGDVKGSSKISRMNNMARLLLERRDGRVVKGTSWSGKDLYEEDIVLRERTVPAVASILRSACKRPW